MLITNSAYAGPVATHLERTIRACRVASSILLKSNRISLDIADAGHGFIKSAMPSESANHSAWSAKFEITVIRRFQVGQPLADDVTIRAQYAALNRSGRHRDDCRNRHLPGQGLQSLQNRLSIVDRHGRDDAVITQVMAMKLGSQTRHLRGTEPMGRGDSKPCDR